MPLRNQGRSGDLVGITGEDGVPAPARRGAVAAGVPFGKKSKVHVIFPSIPAGTNLKNLFFQLVPISRFLCVITIGPTRHANFKFPKSRKQMTH